MNKLGSTLARSLGKIILWVFFAGIVAIGAVLIWLRYYSRDLPETDHLLQFAPPIETSLVDSCLLGPVSAVPLNQISPSFRDAVTVAERSPDGETAFASFIKDLFRDPTDVRIRRGPSIQVARTLFCTPSKRLDRELKEMRTAVQLDVRFSRQQLFTIYLNRLYFGECGTGVENGAECLFHKHAADLTAAESALLAGIVRSPNRLSPSKHPNRALERRNEILDEMVAAGKLSSTEAQSAKSAPLLEYISNR